VASLSATHEAESDSTSLSSEDDINIEHTFSFEPIASESGSTNVAYTRDIANDAVEMDSLSANEKGKNHVYLSFIIIHVLNCVRFTLGKERLTIQS
jgi:hypothetical protein